jgi:hypothetical protein
VLLTKVVAIKEHLSQMTCCSFHDSGSRYVGKMYNDEWMRERGFLEEEIKAEDVIKIILISHLLLFVPKSWFHMLSSACVI